MLLPTRFIGPALRSTAERPPRGRVRGGVEVGRALNGHSGEAGEMGFRQACRLGLEGIVSKRLGSHYVSGRSRYWLKFKNPNAPAMKREAEEDWGKER